jgi:hypothetical protein
MFPRSRETPTAILAKYYAIDFATKFGQKISFEVSVTIAMSCGMVVASTRSEISITSPTTTVSVLPGPDEIRLLRLV